MNCYLFVNVSLLYYVFLNQRFLILMLQLCVLGFRGGGGRGGRGGGGGFRGKYRF